MSWATQRIGYSGQESTLLLADWLRLEQEEIPVTDEETGLALLGRMLAAVKSGRSAHSVVFTECRWLEILGPVVRVSLDFYVWPSRLDLPYQLTVPFGEVSEAEEVQLHRSFDVIFRNQDAQELGFVFAGEFWPEMPFFAGEGSELPATEITLAGSRVTLSAPCTTVLRATGIATGYRHRLVMELGKGLAAPDEDPELTPAQASEVYAVTGLRNQLTASWVDEHGETRAETMTMELPRCVEDLLAVCKDGRLLGVVGCLNRSCNGGDTLKVYYSTCTGEVILARVEEEQQR